MRWWFKKMPQWWKPEPTPEVQQAEKTTRRELEQQRLFRETCERIERLGLAYKDDILKAKGR